MVHPNAVQYALSGDRRCNEWSEWSHAGLLLGVEAEMESGQPVDTVGTKIEGMNAYFTAHLESFRKEITAEITVIRTDLSQKLALMRGEIFVVKTSIESSKVWTLTLLATIAASLLGVMAHRFKWL